MRTPNGSSTTMKNSAWNAPNAAAPARRPTRMLTRDVGVASSRSKKPCSMSVASAVPPVTLPNSTALHDAAGDCEVEEVVDLREVGQAHGASERRTAERGEEQREDQRRDDQRGLTDDGRIDRFDIASVCDDAQALGLHRAEWWWRQRQSLAPSSLACRRRPAGVGHRRRRALQPVAGRLGEHVVEARLVELEVVHLDAGLVEAP